MAHSNRMRARGNWPFRQWSSSEVARGVMQSERPHFEGSRATLTSRAVGVRLGRLDLGRDAAQLAPHVEGGGGRQVHDEAPLEQLLPVAALFHDAVLQLPERGRGDQL